MSILLGSRPTQADSKGDVTTAEDRLRRAQELGGAFPYEWSAETGLLLTPDGFGRLYGLNSNEGATYEAVTSRIHPDDAERVRATHRNALALGGSYEQEYRVLLPDGSTRWLMARGQATVKECSINGIAGVVVDITRMKNAELALAQREAELAERERFIRNVLASSDDCIKVLDLDTKLQFMSEGGKRVMEVDDFGKIEGCRWVDFWTGASAQDAERAVSTAKAGGTGRFEGPCNTVAGTPRWWDVAVTAIRGEDGRVESLLSISRDITERREAREALRRSQERLELAISAGKIGTWVWDIPNGTISADERLAEMFGVDPTEAERGAPAEAYLAAIHPEDRDRVASARAEVVERGGEYEIEQRLLQADGSSRWVVARGKCQLDALGRTRRISGATVDITDLKRAQEERELVTRELAHRIKNIFAVVGGIVALSSRSHPEARGFAEAMRERLTALAQAHEYVRPHSPKSQRPHHTGQTFLGLMEILLAPYREGGEDRVSIMGTDVPIGARTATSLALIIHEQATNAVKYGALSNQSGKVQLSSEADASHIHIVWREAGGPPVLAKPERRGFGTELAARSVAGLLGGTLDHDWHEKGLVMRMSIPIERLSN